MPLTPATAPVPAYPARPVSYLLPRGRSALTRLVCVGAFFFNRAGDGGVHERTVAPRRPQRIPLDPARRWRVGTSGKPAKTMNDTIHDALIECVRAAGGSKVVAAELWPAKAARNLDDARRYLTSCLDAERNEKLSLDEIMHVLRLARAKGCHAGMQFMAHALSYAEPKPIEPKDEVDDLRRRMLAMWDEMKTASDRLAQLERPATSNVRAVS